RRPWAARGRDFFPFEVEGGESIGSLEARDGASGAALPVEIYASPGELKSAADLLGELVPVKAGELRAGARWLLAVPMEAQGLLLGIHVDEARARLQRRVCSRGPPAPGPPRPRPPLRSTRRRSSRSTCAPRRTARSRRS